VRIKSINDQLGAVKLAPMKMRTAYALCRNGFCRNLLIEINAQQAVAY